VDGVSATLPDDGPTEVASPRAIAAESRGGTTIVSPADALLQDARIGHRMLARVAFGGSALAAAAAPVLGGPVPALLALVAGLVVLTVTNAIIYWLAASADRFDPRALALCWYGATVSLYGPIYYFGPFSAALMALVMGIYLASRSVGVRTGNAVYAIAASLHLVLVVLLELDVVPALSLVSPELMLSEVVVIETLLQTLLAATWLVARHAQRALDGAVHELDEATRAIALREALLDEARLDLERVAKVGGPGRLTDARLGGFDLHELIGRGGMGEVYAATRSTDGAEAAVKVLHPHLVQEHASLARFLRESEIVSRLESPHVVGVYEVGHPDTGVPYLAMERMRGQDLATHLRARGRLPEDEYVTLAEQVGAGLAAAHREGVIHRDVKPQNLFRATLHGRTTWKLIDFGIAKLASGSGTLTSGHMVGTPRYVAPEQAVGEEVDARADVYALGAVLYRCVTGRPPYPGKESASILYHVVHEMPVQPTRVDPSLPADLDAFFAIAMAKSPDDRFADPAALVSALRDAARDRLRDRWRRQAEALIAAHPWSR